MTIRITKLIFKLMISLLFVSLYACSSDDNVASTSSKATTEMPSELQKLTLSGGGTLAAYVTIDGDTANRRTMSIDGAGSGSASASIPGLTLAPHTIVISYEYTDTNGTIVLASASNTVDLTSGSGSLSFVAADYDLDTYDEDGDGISNAAELAAGTDPRDDACVIGASIIGDCTLG